MGLSLVECGELVLPIVRVLGAVEVEVEGRPIEFGRLERSVVSILAARVGRVVSVDGLIEGLWEEQAPATARNRVQALVSAVRRSCSGFPIVRTRPPGYLMRLEDVDHDGARFESLTRLGAEATGRGEHREAARIYEEALALWRGPAFDGSTAAQARAEAVRLEEIRRTVAAGWADARLAIGDHATIASELASLVAADPLHERLRGLLMLALHRAGRQAEALQVYAEGATVLARDHGLDPGPQLQRLRQQVLVNDPAISPSAHQRQEPTPAQLPAALRRFVGRSRETQRLDALLSQHHRSSAMTVAALSGMAGVGKTTLAVHWAHQVACQFPDGQLYIDLRGFDSVAPMRSDEALQVLLRALGVGHNGLPASPAEQTGLYRSFLANRRILLVLDNARDSEQVRPLLPGSPNCFVVVSSRTPLAGLVATAAAEPIPLNLFTQGEALQMISARLGPHRISAEPAAIGDLIETCARLPLALSIVTARAATEPSLRLETLAAQVRRADDCLDELDGGDPATNVRTVFSWSLASLTPSAVRLFMLLCLNPGPEISTRAAMSLAGASRDVLRAQMRELARASLIADDSSGRYAIHDLLRAYGRGLSTSRLLETDRTEAVRRMLDHYLGTAIQAALVLAPHRMPIEHAEPAPGSEAEAITDHDEATAWFSNQRRTLINLVASAADTPGMEAYSWQLAWTLVDAFDRQGHWQDWADVHRVALEAAAKTNDLIGCAHAHRGLGRAYVRLEMHKDAGIELAAALTCFQKLGDTTGLAHANLDLAWLCDSQERFRDAVLLADRAHALFQMNGNSLSQAHALAAVGWYRARQGDYRGSCRELSHALDLHRQHGDRHGEAAAAESLGYAHFHLREYDEVARNYRHALDICQVIGDHYGEAVVLERLGDAYQEVSAEKEAQAAWSRAAVLLDELGNHDAARVRRKLLGSPLQS